MQQVSEVIIFLAFTHSPIHSSVHPFIHHSSIHPSIQSDLLNNMCCLCYTEHPPNPLAFSPIGQVIHEYKVENMMIGFLKKLFCCFTFWLTTWSGLRIYSNFKEKYLWSRDLYLHKFSSPLWPRQMTTRGHFRWYLGSCRTGSCYKRWAPLVRANIFIAFGPPWPPIKH